MKAGRRLILLLALLAAACEQPAPPSPPPAPPRREPVLLQHQKPVTDLEYERAVAAWAQGKKAFAQRARYLAANRLQPSLYMPGLGWNDVVTNPFRQFLESPPSRARVDQLRLHTQSFTGFSLYLFQLAGGMQHPPAVVPAAQWDATHRGRKPDGSVWAFERLRRELPAKYVVSVPRRMGEVGWDVDGHVVNWDTVAYQESIAVLYRSGALAWLEKRAAAGEKITVVEIGSGYGGFAYFLTQLVPGVNYWLCDLPESLPVAAMYLAVTRPEAWRGIYPECQGACDAPGLVGVANYRFEEFSRKVPKADLVINMLSLSEMPEAQIDYYGRKVSRLIGGHGVFFEQNYDNRSVGFTDAKALLPRHFGASSDLGTSAKRGHGHLWANDAALLERIRAGRP
jgi:hypothetical protein